MYIYSYSISKRGVLVQIRFKHLYFFLIPLYFNVVQRVTILHVDHAGLKRGGHMYILITRKNLVDWTTFSSIFSVMNSTSARTHTHVFPVFLTPVLHTTVFPSNWLLLHIYHWWKNNAICRFDFYQTSEIMFAGRNLSCTDPLYCPSTFVIHQYNILLIRSYFPIETFELVYFCLFLYLKLIKCV